MAHHKSAQKRIRQTKKRNQRNTQLRSALRTELKKFRVTIAEENIEAMQAKLPSIYKILDKAVTKGILHKGNANRNKSRIALAVNKRKEELGAS